MGQSYHVCVCTYACMHMCACVCAHAHTPKCNGSPEAVGFLLLNTMQMPPPPGSLPRPIPLGPSISLICSILDHMVMRLGQL